MEKHCCSFCGSNDLREILNFGNVSLAGGFIEESFIGKEKKYPMTFAFCYDCKGVQISEKIDEDEMFKNYFYFSSQIRTLKNHFSEHAKRLTKDFIKKKDIASVLEFGSNDGILLRPLVKEEISQVIGVDPAKNVVEENQVEGATQIVGYFNENLSKDLLKLYGKQDLILANNCYAHINDINSTTQAVKNMLKDDGMFIFEVHHLLKLINELQFDMIYHEHIYYYSVMFLKNYFKKFSMKIYMVEEIDIHAGSIRVFACNDDSKVYGGEDSSVEEVLIKEKESGLDDIRHLHVFKNKVLDFKMQLNSLLENLISNDKKIIGYGASGRANTILQFCNIDSSTLDYIIDDSPVKQGLYTPGSHIKIVDKSILEKNLHEYVLLFAWAFVDEIAKRNKTFLENGGKFIVPFPEIKIIGIEDLKK